MQTTEIRRLQDNLKTPPITKRCQTNMCNGHYHILMSSWKNHYYSAWHGNNINSLLGCSTLNQAKFLGLTPPPRPSPESNYKPPPSCIPPAVKWEPARLARVAITNHYKHAFRMILVEASSVIEAVSYIFMCSQSERYDLPRQEHTDSCSPYRGR